MSASKEYKAVRNCILNELHLTKEDIIKNIEPLLEKLVKQCMNNTYGNNNQIEHWIRCMVNDELNQRDSDFVRRICKEVIKDHVLNELNIIVSPKNERCVCENRVPSRKDGLYLIYEDGHAKPFSFARNQIFKVMNELVNFKNEDFGEIRTMLVDGVPYFVGRDVALALGYAKPRNAILQHVDNEDALKQGIPDSQGFMQQTTLINESGVYSLIFGSKLETAKSFKKWVTSEVLPSIRKTGSYSVIPSYQIEDPIKRAEKWIEEQKEKKALEIKVGELSVENKELEKRIEEDAPKVIFAMAVTESKRSCLVAELAKIICQNGMEIGQNRLFKWLRKKGYLGTKGEYYNQPMQRYVEAGLFEIKKRVITKPNGRTITVSTPMVTPAGQLHILNKFLEYYSKM